jgi:hypothetical protein
VIRLPATQSKRFVKRGFSFAHMILLSSILHQVFSSIAASPMLH